METGRDIINRLAASDTSTETDGAILQVILRKLGFPNAIVTCGVVYLEGRGTIDAPPTTINTVAKMIMKIVG